MAEMLTDLAFAEQMVIKLQQALLNSSDHKSARLKTATGAETEYDSWPIERLQEQLSYWQTRYNRLKDEAEGTTRPIVGLIGFENV